MQNKNQSTGRNLHPEIYAHWSTKLEYLEKKIGYFTIKTLTRTTAGIRIDVWDETVRI